MLYIYADFFTGNAAFNKTAEQGEGSLVSSLHAMLATDGFHYEGGCATPWHGARPYTPAWWRVDLGTTYVILGIDITSKRRKYTDNISIYFPIFRHLKDTY